MEQQEGKYSENINSWLCLVLKSYYSEPLHRKRKKHWTDLFDLQLTFYCVFNTQK